METKFMHIAPDLTPEAEGYLISGKDMSGNDVTIKILYDESDELFRYLEEEFSVSDAIGLREGTIRQVGPFLIDECNPEDEISIQDCLHPEMVSEPVDDGVFPIPDKMLSAVHDEMVKNGLTNETELTIMQKLIAKILSLLGIKNIL